MKAWLNGKKKVHPDTAKSALNHLLDSWAVESVMEAQPIPEQMKALMKRPGVYVLYGSAGDVIYVGQASDLKAEITQTLNREANFSVRRGPKITKRARPKFRELTTRISVYIVERKNLRHNLEAFLLRVFLNETHNNKLGNFRNVI